MTRPSRWHVLFALLALLGGCISRQSGDDDTPVARTPEEGAALVAELKTFERRMGYQETPNFLSVSRETEAIPFCGTVSRRYLPYSYQDPAIRWLNSVTEEECRALGDSADVSFGESEAVGESETPITASMLSATMARFVYLVIHEDCHDQFGLPFGIEEALCNVIAFNAMPAFGAEKFGAMPRERQAMLRFAREGAARAHLTVGYYERLAALYARYESAKMPLPVLLRERERLFRTAEREFAWPAGSMNNVWIANSMTYARHYPLIERVFNALGRDLPRTVAFFKTVDAAKPPAAAVMTKHHLQTESGVAFVRAYETAVVETIEKTLAGTKTGPPPRSNESPLALRPAPL